MSRSSFALALLAALAALAAAAPAAAVAPTIYKSTFRGDGFDAGLWSSDGCREISLYFYGADYVQKEGPGQPTSSNYLGGYAYVFDCDSQSWGEAYLDLINATVSANGANSTTTVSGSTDVQFGHWEEGTVEECYSWEARCFDDNWEFCDCALECAVEEPAGEQCYFPSVWVVDNSQTLTFNLAVAPTGDTYRGMNMGSHKGPDAMYRYRSVGSNRYGNLTGTVTLDGEDLMANAYSWGSVWTANSGSMSIYRF